MCSQETETEAGRREEFEAELGSGVAASMQGSRLDVVGRKAGFTCTDSRTGSRLRDATVRIKYCYLAPSGLPWQNESKARVGTRHVRRDVERHRRDGPAMPS